MSLKVENFEWGKNEERRKKGDKNLKTNFCNPKHEHGKSFLLNNFSRCKTFQRDYARDYQTT